MKDYAHGVAVAIRPAKTGDWKARCPACRATLYRGTRFGMLAAMQAHLDEHHYTPIKGNA